jgi:hypothetical protein
MASSPGGSDRPRSPSPLVRIVQTLPEFDQHQTAISADLLKIVAYCTVLDGQQLLGMAGSIGLLGVWPRLVTARNREEVASEHLPLCASTLPKMIYNGCK